MGKDVEIEEAGEVDEALRPRRRLDCLPGGINAERPCPWVACRHHLYLHAFKKTVREHPFSALENMAETCSLDVADAGPIVPREIALHMGYRSRERAAQVCRAALARVVEEGELEGLDEVFAEAPGQTEPDFGAARG